MIETNIKNTSVDEIMQKIEHELQNRTKNTQPLPIKPTVISTSNRVKTDKLYTIAQKIAKYLKKIGLHKFVYFVKRNLTLKRFNRVYIMSDFTNHYDEKFIDNAYRVILQRETDTDGKNFYLSKLRDGKLSREDIVLKLHFSKEGREKDIKILGSKKRFIIMILYKIPIVGYLIKLGSTILTIPTLLTKINHLENYIGTELAKCVKEEEFKKQLNTKADNQTVRDIKEWSEQQLNTKADNKIVQKIKEWSEQQLNTKATQKEFELYLQAVSYAKEYMKLSSQNLQNLIDETKKRLPNEILNQKELLRITQEEEHKFDSFYVEFEDRFRGTRADIKKRVKVYLPYIEKLPFKKEDIRLLDVGCGRGEWLELLQENKYINIKGLDLNHIMVAKSQELGLTVTQSDVIEYLANLKDESLSVITGFHIIEHLPFEILMTMLKESLRVLKKGGMVIYETPNPENLLVGSCSFYTDPTHINPIPPTTGEFLLQNIGFINTTILRLHPLKEVKYIDDSNFSNINDILYAYSKEQDYSIIGYKR